MSKQHFVFSPVLSPPPNTVDFLKAKSNCSVKRCLYIKKLDREKMLILKGVYM